MKPPPSSRRHHLLCRLLAFVAIIVDPTTTFSFSVCVSSARPTPAQAADLQAAAISRTITVDMAGGGDFTSIQAAIDAVPVGNTRWVRILVKRGTYREKVEIPQSRPHIVMEGEGTHLTVIQWGDYVAVGNSTTTTTTTSHAGGNPVQLTSQTGTFTLRADNFVAKRITFENTHGKVPGNPQQTQALAAMLEGDKAAFYNCSFVGFQDTLCDNRGRHYFRDCYIEGFVDFIFGSGQSIYEGCKIWVVGSSPKPHGYITANGRSDPRSPSGFVFKRCGVDGERLAFLGRAWGTHPRVLFYRTYMAAGAVHPLRWDPFGKPDQVGSMTFAEEDCYGPGSDRPGRVKWAKKLTNREIRRYTSMSFIDGEGWLRRQPAGAAAAAA